MLVQVDEYSLSPSDMLGTELGTAGERERS